MCPQYFLRAPVRPAGQDFKRGAARRSGHGFVVSPPGSHAVGVYTLDSIFLSCTHSSRHFAPVVYELSWLNFDACSLRLGEQLA
jgi:hypothetical protein